MTMITPTIKIPEWAHIPAGAFVMGNDTPRYPEDGEAPARNVWLDAYQLSTTTITNLMFSQFTADTGYVTLAEQQGFSHVFKGQLDNPDAFKKTALTAPWWRIVEGASWRNPNGQDKAEDSLPAVHIALDDALSYCAWSGCRLPSEAEWERAAIQEENITPHTWRGTFPDEPQVPPFPQPVDAATANPLGLYHMCGNVWEWTMDRFATLHPARLTRNPKGPLNGHDRVVKGGSFLCCGSYCARFKPTSRRAETPTASTSHLGFRVAFS